jgi:3-hydroxyphenylacetate 6-hydroxylase
MAILNHISDTLSPFFTTSPSLHTILILPPVLLTIYILINEVIRHRARVPGMQGPPGLPLIGNLLATRTNAAVQYKAWAKTYGDVYQVQMGNVPIVVVNSAKAAKALWVGQSQALSSRPVTYTFHKVIPLARFLFQVPLLGLVLSSVWSTGFSVRDIWRWLTLKTVL